ncbi:MAG: acyl-CoA--6-aminopenicillanic acid acyl-transferase [Bacteroidales bacterium]|nr:acyl-CoA--6-aminopenicillanic acid acyl-transferase [Bacteroidales bacterium]
MKRLSTIAFFLLLLQPVFACTSIIVSGRVTKDGRPLIYKNRDTKTLSNMTIVAQGPRYRYLGLVNAEDTTPVNVWGGHNEAGFAIVNTAAYNLNGDGGDTDGDGILMRKALGLCATLADFERLIDTVKKPMDVNSNFAVLDAHGGCAYYETGNYSFVKFDVNDPEVAPNGYLMRTNFGITGNHKLDVGVERYYAITDFMKVACEEGHLDHDYLVTHIPRYMTHGLTKMNIYDFMPATESDTTFFPFADYTVRYSTASVILVQGVKPGESPLNTVSWTIMGWPLTTIAMPLALTPSGKLPSIVTDDGTGHSWLCEKGLELKSRAFSLKRGNITSYCNISVLFNKQGSGILQKILSLEEEVMRHGEVALEAFRKHPLKPQEMDAFYDWVDAYVKERYQELFFEN